MLDQWVEKTDAEIVFSKGLDGVVKRWPCALSFLGAGETQRKEYPWVRAGFEGKPPRGEITGERSGLCDPGPGRGKGQENLDFSLQAVGDHQRVQSKQMT